MDAKEILWSKNELVLYDLDHVLLNQETRE